MADADRGRIGAGGDILSPSSGAALYFTAAPIVHLGNGNFARAGASVAVRAGVPLASEGLVGGAFGALLAKAYDCDYSDCTTTAFLGFGAVGVGAGVIGAVIIDAAMVAREPVPAEAPRPTPSIASLRPSGAPRKEGGFDIGITGTW